MLVNIRGDFKIHILPEYSSVPEMQECEFSLVCLFEIPFFSQMSLYCRLFAWHWEIRLPAH